MLNITYLDLKKQITYNVAKSDRHREKINSLKELFRQDINSPRQFEKINSISELLRVLETRDVLSEDNTQPLKEIAMRIPNTDELLGIIGRYEWTYKQNDQRNHYVPETIDHEENIPYIKDISTVNINTGVSPNKKHRIYEAVIENIGPFWCNLGRKLKIRECVIDDINKNYSDRYAKAAKLMEFYEKMADPQNWFLDLCSALDEVNMEMLRTKIQHIMMMNI